MITNCINVFDTDIKNMSALRYFSRLFSVLLIIAISWATAINYGSDRTSEKSSSSGTAGDFRFCGEASPAAIIAPNNDLNRQTGIHPRKVSLVCSLMSAKACSQGQAPSSLGNGVSLSACVIQFKSSSLFALHSSLTI